MRFDSIWRFEDISFLGYMGFSFRWRSDLALDSIVFSSKISYTQIWGNKHQSKLNRSPYSVLFGPHNTSALVCGAERHPRSDLHRNWNLRQPPHNSQHLANIRNTMPRTLPWLTGDPVKKEATPQMRTVKQDPDSDHDKTPKASKNAGHFDNEKSDILRSCEYPPYPSIYNYMFTN